MPHTLLNAVGFAGLVWFGSTVILLALSTERDDPSEKRTICMVALIPAFFALLATI